MFGGKSITHKFEVYYQLKGLGYEQGKKNKANTHLNGARRVTINLSENPRLTPIPKTKFNHVWGKSVLPINLKSNTN